MWYYYALVQTSGPVSTNTMNFTSSVNKHGLLPLSLPETPAQEKVWGQLHGSAYGLVLAEAARQYDGLLLVIAADTPALIRLEQEIRFYLDDTIPLHLFPDWETLPYDLFSPHEDIISQRLTTLFRLPAIRSGILLTSIPNTLQRLAPAEYLENNLLSIETGQTLDLDALRSKLLQSGYHCVSEVMEHGEFAVRGAIIDLFPAGVPAPYRLDLFDNEVESIRIFDPDSQRETGRTEAIKLIPAREFPLTEAAIRAFRSRYRQKFSGNPNQHPLYADLSNGITPNGIEYYLPLFFEHTACLFDYLPQATLVVNCEDWEASAETFLEQVEKRYAQRCHDPQRPILAPHELYLQKTELQQYMTRFPRVRLQRTKHSGREHEGIDFQMLAPPVVNIQAQAQEPLRELENYLASHHGRVLFVTESSGRREHLLELLRPRGIRPTPCASWNEFVHSGQRLGITTAPIEHGLSHQPSGLSVITEPQLFGEKAHRNLQRRRKTSSAENVIHNLTDLSVGAPVVHLEHGIGRYQGLVMLEVNGQSAEFLALEYADGDKLYVPVSSLHLVSRYTGASSEKAPLHKLGAEQWRRIKRRAGKRVKDVAAQLLDVYARRAAQKGYAYQIDEQEYLAFASSFPFEETPDQAEAIDAVLRDMASDQPMDRVICGDVGFGKTEVAMRATFVAVQNHRQVAILAPTTLLAQQHYNNFCDRFADWPFKIALLSRFRSKKEVGETLQELTAGKIDIVIGTHKLLQKDVDYHNLGLLVLDEEHRFGVQQKEKLKSLRANVDILTMTATPIPRTLNMSLSGLRDLSIIATPPVERVAIKTFVSQWNDILIQESIEREINRGGQVFFLHNEVSSIDKQARALRELVPRAKIGIAHGQMRERELEQVMLDFYHLHFNLLVCTTIIESGIDIPTANTIIINRADKLGLAQLHQLRGRVGRSHHRAYAYLITPERRAMTAEAVKRLEAIESLETLGSGFMLATHDLEIRGAGELLGDEQSGQIQQIGFTLYSELLDRAVTALKQGQDIDLEQPFDEGPEVDMAVTALIDEDYLPDIHSRLILYKRIANAKTPAALQDLKIEMIDRFGLLTDAIRNLFRVTELKLKAAKLGIHKVSMHARGGRIEFNPVPNIDPAALIELIQRHPQHYKMSGQTKLRIDMELEEPEKRFEMLDKLLDSIAMD